MLNKLQRVTSSGKYFPEIDGLRFIAIVSVVFFHLNGDFYKKDNFTYLDNKHSYRLLSYLFDNGDRGVPLFFVISGFILALPFANHYLKGGRAVGLKSYFTRRLTRLEPPYILAMIVLFLSSVFIVENFTFRRLFPSLVSSLLYVHNVVSYYTDRPYITIVTWSLEIEVQFYILAPLLAQMFKLSALLRRGILLMLILLLPLLHTVYTIPVKTIYDYLHFFLVGFLLADLFVVPGNLKIPKPVSIIAGFVLFAAMWIWPKGAGYSYAVNVLYELVFPLLIFCFFYLVLFTEFWRRLMSIRFISIIGGMCYSIYLLHFAVISVVDNFALRYRFANYYLLDLAIHFILVIIAIFVVCSLFFMLIEKPCMKKNWPQQLWFFLRGTKTKLA